ncbi:MAG TPA: LamG-like jellyroll fold domain-containing protein [Streptosporangiaceae bacterium]|jgi:hypothetical protein
MRPHRWLAAPLTVLLLGTAAAPARAAAAPAAPHPHGAVRVLPSLWRDMVAYYDFEHPARGDRATERDSGRSGTPIGLVNGGAAMRVRDAAHPGARTSIQTRQVDPAAQGDDDWKAGVWGDPGVPSLHAFNAVRGVTIMGWFKTTGTNPSPNTETADPSDVYNAVGLAGILTGNSDGHNVRALLEVITVGDQLRVVALGRRIDTGASQTFAADQPWQSVLPPSTWVHLAATFDYDTGVMRLYKNGRPLDGFYTTPGDPWHLTDTPSPHVTTATDPRGLKIGGSFPQNTVERNPCNCRMDDLMFLNRILTPGEVQGQYRVATH